MTFDCIVLGLGGFGSATLRQLARRGASVLGIEQFGPAHDRGSSHGETRAIRRAYYEHSDYVPLISRAYEHWHALETELGRQLYVRTGLVLTARREREAIAGTLHAAALHQLDIHEIPLETARRDFPTLRFRDEDTVVFERDAGYLLVEDCVRAHLDRARAAGAIARFHEPVRAVEFGSTSVRVRTDCGNYAAAKLIITAGAWSGRLLKELGLPLQVLRKVLLWYPLAAGASDPHRRAPLFLFQDEEGLFYGFPSRDGHTIKIAEHSGGTPCDDPDRLDRALRSADTTPVDAFIARRMHDVVTPAVQHTACMYTITPDHNFIVDRHPEHPNAMLAAGFSGHGFKFTPAIGEALADLALEGRTELPIGFLSLNRPALRAEMEKRQ